MSHSFICFSYVVPLSFHLLFYRPYVVRFYWERFSGFGFVSSYVVFIV